MLAAWFFAALLLGAVSVPLGRALRVLDGQARDPAGKAMTRLGGLALLPVASPAATVAWLLGLHDDRTDSPPALRLLVLALLSAWLAPSSFAAGPWTLDGAVAQACATLWILAVIVAFDFADGIDGWALTAAAVAAWTAGAQPLAAACLGLLVLNAPPARLYLGDNGSNLLGVAVAGALAGDHLDVVPASAAVALPLLDLALAVLRRVRRRAPFSRDRDHLHHRARRLGRWRGLLLLAALAIAIAQAA